METPTSPAKAVLAQLVASALGGDPAAEDQLLARVAPSVRVYARRRQSSHADVEEFVQDALLLVLNALRDGKVSGCWASFRISRQDGRRCFSFFRPATSPPTRTATHHAHFSSGR